MPSRSQHEARARSNEALYGHLQVTATDTFSDWEATSLFYTGLHLVEALLATVSVHPTDHQARQESVGTYLKPAYRAYRQLRELSERARYEPNVEITAQQVGWALGWLQQVRAEVDKELP
jgi:hypothetical protein